jgi:hypothetical protein
MIAENYKLKVKKQIASMKRRGFFKRDKSVSLPKSHFEAMKDEELYTIHKLPGLVINVDEETAEYIKSRLESMGEKIKLRTIKEN